VKDGGREGEREGGVGVVLESVHRAEDKDNDREEDAAIQQRKREGGREGGQAVGRTGTWHSCGLCLNLSIVPKTKAMTERKMHALSKAEMRRAV